MAIRNFSCTVTKQLFYEGAVRSKVGWGSIQGIARRKLMMIHYAKDVLDLTFPPGNRLEKLKGKLKGYHSIRINDQWRIVFKWEDGAGEDVQIVDYH